MERFTERDEFGNAGINGVESMDLQCNLEFDEFNRVTDALNRLADYEDLEEQGKLLELPCAVGDTVYVLEKSQTGKYMVFCTTADSFSCAMWMLDGKFGKCIFPAYGEAEAALKELEKGKGE